MINPAPDLAAYIKTLDALRVNLVAYVALPNALDPRGYPFLDGFTQQPKTVTYTYLIALLKQCENNNTVYTEAIFRALALNRTVLRELLEKDAALANHPEKYALFSADEVLSSPYGSTTGVNRLIALNSAIQGLKQTNEEQLVLCAAKHQALLSRPDQLSHRDTITLLAHRFAALSLMNDACLSLEWGAFNASLGAHIPLSLRAVDLSAQLDKLGREIGQWRKDPKTLAHPAFWPSGITQQVKNKFKENVAAWKEMEIPQGYDFNASKAYNLLSMQLALVKTRQEALHACVVEFSDLHAKILGQEHDEQKIRISK